MEIIIKNVELHHRSWKINAFSIIPANGDMNLHHAVLSHGYTASKESILNWGTTLAQRGIPTIIFDLPGHYLGSFNEVDSFDEFSNHGYQLFAVALTALLKETRAETDRIILGGHSLGALFALLAAKDSSLNNYHKEFVTAGFGLAPVDRNHVFETDFYKSTLNIRRQLISKELSPKNLLPFIKQAKLNLQLQNERIYIVSGKDDIIVEDGATRLKNYLQDLGNEVHLDSPDKLPHNQPELAVYHILKYLRSIHCY